MNIVLIGMRACGKTTVGRVLAQRLAWPFVDTDDLIVAASGLTIRAIFEAEEEIGFRARERVALRNALRGDRQVVAVGGGAVLDDANRALMRAAGRVAWLRASVRTLIDRVRQDPKSNDGRPPLSDAPLDVEVRRMVAAREALYRATADLVCDVDGRTPESIAAEITGAF